MKYLVLIFLSTFAFANVNCLSKNEIVDIENLYKTLVAEKKINPNAYILDYIISYFNGTCAVTCPNDGNNLVTFIKIIF